jgi:hypothetical protein
MHMPSRDRDAGHGLLSIRQHILGEPEGIRGGCLEWPQFLVKILPMRMEGETRVMGMKPN